MSNRMIIRALHELDEILLDSPASPMVKVRAFNYL